MPGSKGRTWSVIVFDMAHTGEPDGEHLIPGFETPEKARAYAEARVRASVEEMRQPGLTPEQIRRLWLLFGEDCAVAGHGPGFADLLDRFIATPATPADCDWPALAPRAAPET